MVHTVRLRDNGDYQVGIWIPQAKGTRWFHVLSCEREIHALCMASYLNGNPLRETVAMCGGEYDFLGGQLEK